MVLLDHYLCIHLLYDCVHLACTGCLVDNQLVIVPRCVCVCVSD